MGNLEASAVSPDLDPKPRLERSVRICMQGQPINSLGIAAEQPFITVPWLRRVPLLAFCLCIGTARPLGTTGKEAVCATVVGDMTTVFLHHRRVEHDVKVRRRTCTASVQRAVLVAERCRDKRVKVPCQPG